MPPQNAPNLQDLLEQQYGVATDFSQTVVAVGSSPVSIAPNNPKRIGLTLINLGTTTVYVAFTSDVSANKGIALSGNGGSFSLNWKDDFSITGIQMYAIDPTGTSNVFAVENYTVSH